LRKISSGDLKRGIAIAGADSQLKFSDGDIAGVMARHGNRQRVGRFRDDANTMCVRLVKKLADVIDDIDLSRARIGDVLTLTVHQALLLIAEGWAVRHASRS
jgi:hypothetical protein